MSAMISPSDARSEAGMRWFISNCLPLDRTEFLGISTSISLNVRLWDLGSRKRAFSRWRNIFTGRPDLHAEASRLHNESVMIRVKEQSTIRWVSTLFDDLRQDIRQAGRTFRKH